MRKCIGQACDEGTIAIDQVTDEDLTDEDFESHALNVLERELGLGS